MVNNNLSPKINKAINLEDVKPDVEKVDEIPHIEEDVNEEGAVKNGIKPSINNSILKEV